MMLLQNSEYHLVGKSNLTLSMFPFGMYIGSKNFNCALKEMKIPISYFKFQGMVSSKVSYFEKHKDEGVPILTWKEIVT